jgi:hypothetical protein
LYIDDKEKASAKGRVILALNIQAVSMELQQPGFQSMALDILLGSDKLYILNVLARIQLLLLDITPN